jgi:plastocyanin
MRKIVILLASVTVLVTGCGGGSSNTAAGGSSTPVKLSGSTTDKGTKDLAGTAIDLQQTDFAFSPTFIKGGTPGASVTVHLKNTGNNPHTFTSTALGVDKTLSPGESADVQITLPQSGASEFHCKFHQSSNGMQGAFFFKDGDTVAGGGAPASSSSSNTGYDYN